MQAETLGADEDLVSQVLEIIGGAVYEALPTPEEDQGGGAWAAEEGDDSVFYSDEDQGGGTGREEDPRAFTKGIPEVEEDRTPKSEQSGAKSEEDRTTEAVTEDASGTGKGNLHTRWADCPQLKRVLLASQLIRSRIKKQRYKHQTSYRSQPTRTLPWSSL